MMAFNSKGALIIGQKAKAPGRQGGAHRGRPCAGWGGEAEDRRDLEALLRRQDDDYDGEAGTEAHLLRAEVALRPCSLSLCLWSLLVARMLTGHGVWP